MAEIGQPFKWGMQQAHTYWRFLVDTCLEDVEQEVRLALLQSDPNQDRQGFNRQVSRNLYSLARAQGWRKRHRDEDTRSGWWIRLHDCLSTVDRIQGVE